MTYYFTDAFRTSMGAGVDLAGTTVKLWLFPTAPDLDVEGGTTTQWAGISKVDLLQKELGWGPYIAGPSVTATAGVNGTLHWVATPNFDLDNAFPDSRIRAIAYTQGTDPVASNIMFVTSTPLGSGTVLTNRDGFFQALDANVGQNVLFYWNATAGTPNGVEGAIRITKGAPEFEAANTQHVWIYPQRVNFIANPSFELNTNFWRVNTGSTLAQSTPAPPGGGMFAGRVSGGTPNVLESNLFPLNYGRRRETGWTVQFRVRANVVPGSTTPPTLHVGLVSWESNFSRTVVNWGSEGGIPIGDGWTYVRTLRASNETSTGMLRLECDASWFEVDQVCVEPGLLPANGVDWPYFEGTDTGGNSGYGARGDFTWYGGTARHHGSYSFWYNLRDTTFGRLFDFSMSPEDQKPGGIFSDVEAAALGMAYQWVPAGTPLIYHLDVLYPYDPKSPLPPVTGPALPYLDDDNPMGVESPWPTTPASAAPDPSPPATGAVSFSAANQAYTRSANGLAGNSTTTFWMKLNADRDSYSVAIGHGGDGGNYVQLGTGSDGVTLVRGTTTAGSVNSGYTVPVGTWVFVASVNDTGAGDDWFAWHPVGGSFNSVSGATAIVGYSNANTLFIANDSFGDWFNGSIAAVKIWDAVLTLAEIQAERNTYAPVRTANVWANYQFRNGPQISDDSSNGRNLTAGAGTPAVDTAGPPIT